MTYCGKRVLTLAKLCEVFVTCSAPEIPLEQPQESGKLIWGKHLEDDGGYQHHFVWSPMFAKTLY